MQPTAYPRVNQLLDLLLPRLQAILGDKLVGVYLYGSLVTGDYDDTLSDVDLMAALKGDLTEAELSALKTMHDEIIVELPHWNDRVEVAYITLKALRTFRTERSNIAVISPGEPFHLKSAGIDWLMNWYYVREIGVTLLGPPASTFIAPISREEFVQCVRDYMLSWRAYIKEISHHHGSQAYAVLTMCRGLYTVRFGNHVSKLKAAAWAERELPQWAGLIKNAGYWREKMHECGTIPTPSMEETERFVQFMIDQVTLGSSPDTPSPAASGRTS